jgi:hypothetical protein
MECGCDYGEKESIPGTLEGKINCREVTNEIMMKRGYLAS